MAIYTFHPLTTAYFVNWSDPAVWLGGVVPDSADADVVFPIVYFQGSAYSYDIAIASGDDIVARSLTLDDTLEIGGALYVRQSLIANPDSDIDMAGGTLSFGSFTNTAVSLQGQGLIQSSGMFTNDSQVIGDGLTISVASFSNLGSLIASTGGGLTLEVAPGGFDDVAGGMLTGGTYAAIGGALDLDVGGFITAIGADVTLEGDEIASFDPTIGQYVGFDDSIDEIAASGTLTLKAGAYDWSPLAVYGALDLQGGALASADLQVAAGGELSGYGALASGIVNNGEVLSGLIPGTLGDDAMSATLTLSGAVSGAGVLEITAGLAGVSETADSEFQPPSYLSTLELGAGASQTVIFQNDVGILQLDDPGAFSGAIRPAGWGDQIVLGGVSLAGIRNVSYQDQGDGSGVLTLVTASAAISLTFLGEFGADNFSLTGNAAALSTTPASVTITLAALTNLDASSPPRIAAQGLTKVSASDASVVYPPAAAAATVAATSTPSEPGGDSDKFPKLTDDYAHAASGTYLGMTYDAYDVLYSAAGVREQITYYGANGLVGLRTFTAEGGETLYLGDHAVEKKRIEADGSLAILHGGASGEIARAPYASFEAAYAAGRLTGVTFYNAAGDIAATRAVSGDGGVQIACATFQNDFDAAGAEVAHTVETSTATGALNIFGDGLVISAATSAIGTKNAADAVAFTARRNETYTLFAGATNDAITFAAGFGAATVRGFAAGDVVDLTGLFANFAQASGAMTASGANTMIRDADGDTLTLARVAASSLTAASLGWGVTSLT